jgi:hypothetical protein
MHLQAGNRKPPEKGHAHVNELGVHVRGIHPEDLGVDLVKLAVSPLLGPLFSEHRTDGVKPGRRIGGINLVLDIGTHH